MFSSEEGVPAMFGGVVSLMRRYRKQRRQRLRSVCILLDETDVAAFIRLGLLKEDQRQDEEALRTAVMSLVYRAQEGLA